MQIKIENPFCLSFDVLEIDEHLPSMRMQVSIEVHQFGYRFGYVGSHWFTCSNWDAFLSNLKKHDMNEALLSDMGSTFDLRLRIADGEEFISWNVDSKRQNGANAMLNFCSPIHGDALAYLKSQFENFGSWW